MFSRTPDASNEDPARSSATHKFHSSSSADPNNTLVVGLQNSLSSMDLNVSPAPSSSSSSSMHHHRTADTVDASTAAAVAMVSAPIVPLHRRTARQRTAERQPVTNRRSICRPRKLTTASSQIFAYTDNQTVQPTMLAVAMIATAHALSSVTESQAAQLNSASQADAHATAASVAATAAAQQREPTAKQITRFYMQANKSAGRVKSTCLETIDECSGEDDETAAAAMLGDHVNFLTGRKLKRSLSFAAAAVHHQRRSVSKQLVQRRKRRILAKLGQGARKPTKFSMQVFLEKMRVLHEADDGEVETVGAGLESTKQEPDGDDSGMDLSGMAPTAAEVKMEATDGV